jgi:transcription elongation factor GreA
MSNYYLTKQGLVDLQKELEELKTQDLPRIQEEIKEARAMGDLRENSALDAAKEQEAMASIRVSEINAILDDYEIIEEGAKASDTIKVGSTVEVSYLEEDKKLTYKIVGVSEVDPANGKISNESPLAKELLGKKVGSEVKVKVRDYIHTVKIVKIS